jgi:hypothetical protein
MNKILCAAAHPLSRFQERAFIPTDEGDVGARGMQLLSDGAPNAAAAACDNCRLTVEPERRIGRNYGGVEAQLTFLRIVTWLSTYTRPASVGLTIDHPLPQSIAFLSAVVRSHGEIRSIPTWRFANPFAEELNEIRRGAKARQLSDFRYGVVRFDE